MNFCTFITGVLAWSIHSETAFFGELKGDHSRKTAFFYSVLYMVSLDDLQ